MKVGSASIVDVARSLGVAPSTVSRAFNHPDRLRSETVAAVVSAAERLGYVPIRHARALITGRSGAIGLVIPDITNPFSRNLFGPLNVRRNGRGVRCSLLRPTTIRIKNGTRSPQ